MGEVLIKSNISTVINICVQNLYFFSFGCVYHCGEHSVGARWHSDVRSRGARSAGMHRKNILAYIVLLCFSFFTKRAYYNDSRMSTVYIPS